MKFVLFLLNRLEWREHYLMFRLFVSKCLLFRSEEKVYWLLGSLAWGSFLLLAYGIFNLFQL